MARADSPSPVDGEDSDCGIWLGINPELFGAHPVTIAEEGWVWANGESTTDKFREVEGVATNSFVAFNDTPANHYSHDWNVDIRVDDRYRGVLSNVNEPNTDDFVDSEADLVPAEEIELEWEIGVTPDERSGDGASPFLPRWVFPNLGDRVWAEGHWVFDCGHDKLINGVPHFKTEVHPARGIATMRQQALPLPGSGTTPVPVTATDLYVHGRGGYMVQQLECGIDIILTGGSCATTTTPIDALYTFEVCLPPKPVSSATLAWGIAAGPGDSGKGADPQITAVQPATRGCQLPVDEFLNDFDDGTMLSVKVDLRGSGIQPTDVYARKIVAGWVYPPAKPLPHLSLTLNRLELHNDQEADPFGAEFTFWWMGVDRAPSDEWHRLVNYEIPTTFDGDGVFCFKHTNKLNDMDDDHGCGDGLLNFSGPEWNFYLRRDTPFSIFTRGFEQDCYDDWFGFPFLISTYVDCHFANFIFEFTNDWGNNDPIEDLNAKLGGAGIDPLTLLGPHRYGVSDEFDFDFTLAQIPFAGEDDADLGVTKTCSWEGEVALAGQPITCSIVVQNRGPGLPRNVAVTDTVTTSLAASDYTVGDATFHVGTEAASHPCEKSTATGFDCAIGTVPVGGSVTIEVEILSLEPGQLTDTATVSTDSTDADATNDEDEVSVDVYLPVPVDIEPGSTTNPVNISKQGVVTIAILTTSTFDATSLTVADACFGDAEDASQRNCAEIHGKAHVADVDKDKDVDLVFHFSVPATGIDLGDTTACLKGTTTVGIGFYGCDAVRPS